jgi:hypothetical protein
MGPMLFGPGELGTMDSGERDLSLKPVSIVIFPSMTKASRRSRCEPPGWKDTALFRVGPPTDEGMIAGKGRVSSGGTSWPAGGVCGGEQDLGRCARLTS